MDRTTNQRVTKTASARTAEPKPDGRETAGSGKEQRDSSPTAVLYLRARAAGKTGAERAGLEDRMVEAQRRRCLAWADRAKVTVMTEYMDLGASAADMQRPQFVAMLERLKTKRDVDYVITDRRDRLSRSIQADIALMTTFEEVGVKLVIAQEGTAADPIMTPAGRFLHELTRAIDQFVWEREHRDRSEAAKQGWKTRRANVRQAEVQAP